MLSAAGILVSRLDLQLSNFASVAMNYPDFVWLLKILSTFSFQLIKSLFYLRLRTDFSHVLNYRSSIKFQRRNNEDKFSPIKRQFHKILKHTKTSCNLCTKERQQE